MAKLTDTQLIVLSAAAARDKGYASVPSTLKKQAAAKVGTSLTARKPMREMKAQAGLPVWREDGDGRAYSLVITAAGRKAIRVDDEAQQASAVSANAPHPAAHDLVESSKTDTAVLQRSLRESSKQALVIKMLSAEGGTTLNAIVDATGWLPLTTRAVLTALAAKAAANDPSG